MAMAFARASWWLLGGGKDAHQEPTSSTGLPPSASSPDTNSVWFPGGRAARVRSARPWRRWQSGEERWRRVDREFDLVMVPSNGGMWVSGMDDSDWSIGWLEPHAPGFLGGDGDGDGDGNSEAEGSFAVLVPPPP